MMVCIARMCVYILYTWCSEVGIATFDGAKSATEREREKEWERGRDKEREKERERGREWERTSCCVRMLLGTCCGKLCGGSFPVARATGSLFLLPHIYIIYSFVAFATLCINWTWTSHTQSLCELMFSRQTVFDDGHK